jgi:hypothetical protein
MTLPRPVLIALLGVALCAAAFLATRSANDTSVGTSAPAPSPVTTHKVTKPAPAAKKHGPAAHKATPADQHKPAQAKAHKPVHEAAAAKPEVKPHAVAPVKPETTKPAKPPVSDDVAKTLPAIKALGRGDVVVFFFTHAGPADDTGTAQAVKTLKGEPHVSVFKVGLEDLELYRPVLSGAGVSQVPAIVVVKAGKKARLLQGFVDARTLRQTVADARR